MRRALLIAAAMGALTLAGPGLAATPKPVADALADSTRPEADKARDAERHAADIVALTGVKAGDRVADIFPGGGYYSRIFAKVVGPQGQVVLLVPQEAARTVERSQAVAKDYPNSVVTVAKMAEYKPDKPLDVVFNSQFYHDMLNPSYGGPDIAAQNKAIFNALKPGGIYFIIDHSAPAGTGTRDIATVHRIDEAEVKKALTAAGFVLEAESQVLRNSADDRTANVFSPAIRGKTDQFVLKFRKPRR